MSLFVRGVKFLMLIETSMDPIIIECNYYSLVRQNKKVVLFWPETTILFQIGVSLDWLYFYFSFSIIYIFFCSKETWTVIKQLAHAVAYLHDSGKEKYHLFSTSSSVSWCYQHCWHIQAPNCLRRAMFDTTIMILINDYFTW